MMSSRARSLAPLLALFLASSCTAAAPDVNEALRSETVASDRQAFTTVDPSVQPSTMAAYAQSSPVTTAAIFAPKPNNVDVAFDLQVPSSTFYQPATGTLDKRNAAGYHLVSMSIDTIDNSLPLISAIFHKDAVGSQLVILPWSSFLQKRSQLSATGVGLVDVSTYVQNGQRYFVGVFRPGMGSFVAPVSGMSWADLGNQTNAKANLGLSLVKVRGYVDNGKTYYLGLWQPMGPTGHSLWGGDWNAFSKYLYDRAADGQRLVDMTDLRRERKPSLRRYVARWDRRLRGRRRDERTGLRAQSQRSDQPPRAGGRDDSARARLHAAPGLAAAFHDQVDSLDVGYSYAVNVHDVVTALGAFGNARAPWESINPSLPMTINTRMKTASTTKTFTAVAMLKLAQQQNIDMNTPFVTALGPYAASCGALGAGVSAITLKDLMAQRSGLYDDQDCNICASIQKPATDTKEYRNINFCILKKVIEAKSNTDFDTYLENNVLTPSKAYGIACEHPGPSMFSTLYYAQSSQLPGTFFDSPSRSMTVCGAGGLQAGAQQLSGFHARVESRCHPRYADRERLVFRHRGAGLRRHLQRADAHKPWARVGGGRAARWTSTTAAWPRPSTSSPTTRRWPS